MELATAKAVITGGASGLGYATAERVIGAGGHVVLLDINDELGEASAAKLGDRAAYLNTDVANEASVKESIAKANEIMGGITLAVNCAGIATAGRTLGREGPWPSELFNKVIQVNLVGSFNVTKEAAAFMVGNEPTDDGERGVVISTASIAAFEGQIGQAAYSASKGGIADEWHTDLTFLDSPSLISILNMKVCPEVGGDTDPQPHRVLAAGTARHEAGGGEAALAARKELHKLWSTDGEKKEGW